jgi:hypothetical protein
MRRTASAIEARFGGRSVGGTERGVTETRLALDWELLRAPCSYTVRIAFAPRGHLILAPCSYTVRITFAPRGRLILAPCSYIAGPSSFVMSQLHSSFGRVARSCGAAYEGCRS